MGISPQRDDAENKRRTEPPNLVVVLDPKGTARGALERILPDAPRRGYQTRFDGEMALAVKSPSRPITVRAGDDRDVILMGNLVSECVCAAEALDWAVSALLEKRLEDLKRLQGVFVLLLLDWQARTATVVSDLLGMRPFYVARQEGLTVLSDRADATCRLGGGGVDWLGLASWICMGMIVADRTMFESVRRLAPASVTRFGTVSMQQESFWDPPVTEEPIDQQELTDGISEDFSRSLSRLLEPYEAATSLLSGGFDSRLCLLTALRQGQVKLDAVTVPFSDCERQVVDELVNMTRVPCARVEIKGSIWDEYDSIWYHHPDGHPITKNFTYLCATRLGRPGPFIDGSNSDTVLRSEQAYPGKEPPDQATAREYVWKIHARHHPELYFRPGTLARLERLAREAADEQSRAIGWSTKSCLRWDICTDERRHTSLNHLQYTHLAPSVQPFYDRSLLERRLRHPNSVYTTEAYRAMLERHFPGPGGLPHASDLPKGHDHIYAFSWTVWRHVPRMLRFVGRHRDAMRQRWLQSRLASYGLGRRSHMYLVLELMRLAKLEEQLHSQGIELDFNEVPSE